MTCKVIPLRRQLL